MRNRGLLCTRYLAAAACCLALSLAALGCGSSSRSTTSAAKPSDATTAWRTQTQAICRDARVAVARLGYVHITYAGIAQIGVSAVKAKLGAYLEKLLTILRTYAARLHSLNPPAGLSSAASMAHGIGRQEEAAVGALRVEVATAKTAGQLSAAFRSWVERNDHLAAQGNAVARRLGLPDCVASAQH